jgi:predicted nucleic acid-binding protein
MGGVILDSSVPIRAERQGLRPGQFLRDIQSQTPYEDVGLSAIGVTELFHGIYRADTPARAELRRRFLASLIDDLPVFDYTLEVAHIAGRIDGEQTMKGNIIPWTDLLIGATALVRGYSVMTTNLKHFRQIPGLNVIAF